MEKKTYPLLYYKLNDNAVLGILVGTEYEVVDKDLRNVKALLSEYLAKQYKKYDEYPYTEIVMPKLKVFQVNVRPAYKNDNGLFPINTALKVPVVAVYGEHENGHFECHLPLFNRNFYYYDAKQFASLVTHFSTNLLNNLAPEELYRHMQFPKPQLDYIHLKVNENRDFNWEEGYERTYPALKKVADPYPPTKAVRRKISAFPEAAWELENKVEEVVDILVNVGSSLLVVGAHGVGKSSVLKQAIKKIVTRNRKQRLGFTFWQMMPQRITATAKYLGEWQQTCEEMVDDLAAANGVLWVMDFIRLLQIGGGGPEDSVAAFLASFINKGKIQIVGEVTPREYESLRRLLPGFADNFQVIKIEELPEKKIHTIMDKFSEYCGKNLKINVSKDAVELSYRLLLRYFPYERFPGKAVKFLAKAVSEAQINQSNKICRPEVLNNFIQQTGMPELFLRDDILLDHKDPERYFNKQIMGQKAVISHLCTTVKVFKAGLNNPHKPITTMLFSGPTGVGKTASAKALANYFFGKGQKRSPLIRIDMSEFQHPGMLSRFIGAGNEVGKLVQEIRERPFSVLLLDEVEKADPSIFDALLTVLDEGVLVDNFGRTTNFRNTIIIMTSNLGATNQRSIGFGGEDAPKYDSAIRDFFRPEFINRIDHVVVFNSLNSSDIKKITEKELEELKQREGFEKRGLKLEFTPAVAAHLSKVGFDVRYGARPLQRAMEMEVVSPLAKWLLEHPTLNNCTLKVDFSGGALKIVRK